MRADLVADAERDVVGRALGAPVVEERRRIPGEADPRVRVPDPERRPGDRLALRREELEPTVGGLRQTEDRDRAEADLHLDREPGARLPVVEPESARNRASVRDREMARAVVAHEDETLVEVETVELGVRPTGAEPVEQEHRDVGLEVAFAGGRDAARGEQRVADDEARAHPLGGVVADAAVVVGESIELEVLDEAIEPDGDARRPVEELGRDLGGDRVGAGVRQVEDVPDLVSFLSIAVGAGRLDAGDEVVDLEHLDVCSGLRVHLREVGVHVEHPRVRVAEEADARCPEAAARRAPRPAIRAGRPTRGRPRAASP